MRSRVRKLALLALAIPTVAAGAFASELRVEAPTLNEFVVEARVAPPEVLGEVQYSYVAAPTRIEAETWRFWVQSPEAAGDIVLRETGTGEKTVGRIAAKDVRRGTWSPQIDLPEVFFATPAGLHVEVRLLSWPQIAIDTQTPVGRLNLAEVLPNQLPLRLRRHVQGVGRLALLKTQLADARGSENSFIYCTAFLISAEYAVTARHCIDLGLEGRLAELSLGYLATVPEERISRHAVTLAAASEPLDVAVLALDPPADGDAALILAEADPEAQTEVMVLQHFAAAPLTISADDECLALAARFNGPPTWDFEAGKELTVDNALFAHGCDTTSTSSGSPVLDRQSYRLVGMHQQGFFKGETPQNRALRVSLLRKFLESAGVMNPG